jgi:hypothetical protein
MTSALVAPSFKNIAVGVAGLLFALSCFFAVAPQAHASSLTEPQIQSVLNLLAAFNVDSTTVANVDSILHGRTPDGDKGSGLLTVNAWLEDPTGNGKESFAFGDQLLIKWSAYPLSDVELEGWYGNAPDTSIELRPAGDETSAGIRIVHTKATTVFPYVYTWNVTEDGLYGDKVAPGKYYVYVNVASKQQGGYRTGVAGPIWIGAQANTSLSATPTSGQVPLSVRFYAPVSLGAYLIDYGDNSVMTCAYVQPGADVCDLSGVHTYTTAGTYTAILETEAGRIGATQTITVGGGPAIPRPSCTLSYSPTTLTLNDTLTIRWTSTNATSRTLSLLRDGQEVVAAPTQGLDGEVRVSPIKSDGTVAGSYVRTDTVVGPGGTATCQAQVLINPLPATPSSAMAPGPVVAVADPSNIFFGGAGSLMAAAVMAPYEALVNAFADLFVAAGVH